MEKRNRPVSGWHHLPEVPLRVSPFFRLPLEPIEMVKWLWSSWFLLSERLILVGIAFFCVIWTQPNLVDIKILKLDWIFQLWLRNIILMTMIAGGLHLYLYSYKKQGDKLKYDPRPLMVKGRQFSLGGQIRDNMFWTLASGVTVWTFYEVLIFWAMANGWVPVLTWSDSPLWFIGLFIIIPIWESFYFYWTHRMLHWPPLYKLVHSVHHRNINVGPWSGLSMHPIEHFIFLGSVLVHWVIPANPVHILYHMQYFALTAATTHAGFEGIAIKDQNRLRLGTFHHQMHHRYFECNYGGLEFPWDKFFGSFHDGTQEADEAMKARRAKMTVY